MGFEEDERLTDQMFDLSTPVKKRTHKFEIQTPLNLRSQGPQVTLTRPKICKNLHLNLAEQRRFWSLAQQAEGRTSFYEASTVLKTVQTKTLNEQLMHRDTQVAFMLLWTMLEPSSLVPVAGSGHNFAIPRVEMEIDHQGCFANLANGYVSYAVGETKSSHTGMQLS